MIVSLITELPLLTQARTRSADLESNDLFLIRHTLDVNQDVWEQSASSLTFFATLVTFFSFLFPLYPHIHPHLPTQHSLHRYHFQILAEVHTHRSEVEAMYKSWELRSITRNNAELLSKNNKEVLLQKEVSFKNCEAGLVKAMLLPPPCDGFSGAAHCKTRMLTLALTLHPSPWVDLCDF